MALIYIINSSFKTSSPKNTSVFPSIFFRPYNNQWHDFKLRSPSPQERHSGPILLALIAARARMKIVLWNFQWKNNAIILAPIGPTTTRQDWGKWTLNSVWIVTISGITRVTPLVTLTIHSISRSRRRCLTGGCSLGDGTLRAFVYKSLQRHFSVPHHKFSWHAGHVP